MQSNIAQIEVTNNKRFMLPINITELLEQNRIESNRIEYKQGWNPTASIILSVPSPMTLRIWEAVISLWV